MKNPLRRRGIGSLAVLVGISLALSIVAGLSLTHAVVPTVDAFYLWSNGGIPERGMASMLFSGLWLALLGGVPLYLLYRLATRSR